MNSIFLAVAMEHQTPGRLAFVEQVLESVEAEYGPAFYAPRQWSDPKDYPPPVEAFNIVLDGIDQSKLFVLYYPDKIPSGALVELGLALAKGKLAFVYTEKEENLTYFLREGGVTLTVSTNHFEILPWIEQQLKGES